MRTTDGRTFAGVNVENAAYPLGICAEKTALGAAATAGVKPGEIAAIGITASPCGGCRQWLHEWRIPEVSFRRDGRDDRDVGRRASCCPTPGTSPNEVGLRRRRRAPERRQVDARERPHGREGRDRLRQAAHDAPPHPRRPHLRRGAARARRPAGLAAADRSADRADAGDRERGDRRRRRRDPARPQRARAHRRGRPLRRAARLPARRARW